MIRDVVVSRALLEGDLELELMRLAVAQCRDVLLVEGGLGRERAAVRHVVEEDVDAVGLVLEAQVAHAPAVPVVRADRHVQTGLSSVVCVVPTWNPAAKFRLEPVASPAGLASPGEKVWSPKLPLVTASDMRSACAPNPYRAAAG